MWLGHDADHSAPSSADVKSEYALYLLSHLSTCTVSSGTALFLLSNEINIQLFGSATISMLSFEKIPPNQKLNSIWQFY
jgi:hypothetical protein